METSAAPASHTETSIMWKWEIARLAARLVARGGRLCPKAAATFPNGDTLPDAHFCAMGQTVTERTIASVPPMTVIPGLQSREPKHTEGCMAALKRGHAGRGVPGWPGLTPGHDGVTGA